MIRWAASRTPRASCPDAISSSTRKKEEIAVRSQQARHSGRRGGRHQPATWRSSITRSRQRRRDPRHPPVLLVDRRRRDIEGRQESTSGCAGRETRAAPTRSAARRSTNRPPAGVELRGGRARHVRRTSHGSNHGVRSLAGAPSHRGQDSWQSQRTGERAARKTGAGMMDCKAALDSSGGDFEGAVRYLREKGPRPRPSAPAGRRGGRHPRPSREPDRRRDDRAQLRDRLRCQDPQFQELAGSCWRVRGSHRNRRPEGRVGPRPGGIKVGGGKPVADVVAESIASMGVSSSAASRVFAEGGRGRSAHVHAGGKIGVLVEAKTTRPVLGAAEVEKVLRDVAMQIAAANPPREARGGRGRRRRARARDLRGAGGDVRQTGAGSSSASCRARSRSSSPTSASSSRSSSATRPRWASSCRRRPRRPAPVEISLRATPTGRVLGRGLAKVPGGTHACLSPVLLKLSGEALARKQATASTTRSLTRPE